MRVTADARLIDHDGECIRRTVAPIELKPAPIAPLSRIGRAGAVTIFDDANTC